MLSITMLTKRMESARMVAAAGLILKQENMKADANVDDPLRGLQYADLIGRGGLEALCEPTLRGTRGKAWIIEN